MWSFNYLNCILIIFLLIFFLTINVDLESADPSLAPIVEAMREKFLKYWEHVPPITLVAHVLHPTYKLHYTTRMLQIYHANLGLQTGEEEPTIRQLLQELVSTYSAQPNVDQPSSSQRRRYNLIIYNLLFLIIFLSLLLFLTSTFLNLNRTNSQSQLLQELDEGLDMRPSNANELETYLSLPNVADGIDVLEYWKKNANMFPTLARIARDVFAVPMSTVPSESCFSSANRILTDKRYTIKFLINLIILLFI